MNTPEKMAALFGEARLEIVHAWVERLDHTTPGPWISSS